MFHVSSSYVLVPASALRLCVYLMFPVVFTSSSGVSVFSFADTAYLQSVVCEFVCLMLEFSFLSYYVFITKISAEQH